MLLAIDVGNTNVVFAVFEDDKLRFRWQVATIADRTADEYAVLFSQLSSMHEITLADFEEAIVATVVPQALFNIRELCRKYCHCDPIVVGNGVALPIRILVTNPQEVGVDRLINSVAAHERYPGALIIVDLGTATTFDIVDANGNYYGGVIAPGINLSLEALHLAAAQLPRIEVKRPGKVIGGDTLSAMQSGVYWGYIGLLEGLVGRIRAEFREVHCENGNMTVIGTGGFAPLFADGTDIIQIVDPDLTLVGLASVNQYNRRSFVKNSNAREC